MEKKDSPPDPFQKHWNTPIPTGVSPGSPGLWEMATMKPYFQNVHKVIETFLIRKRSGFVHETPTVHGKIGQFKAGWPKVMVARNPILTNRAGLFLMT